MARDKTPDVSKSDLKNVKSSEDLLNNAYSSLGMTRRDKRASAKGSLSAKMASTATSDAIESSEPRTETAEEIAKMLVAETKRRTPARRRSTSQRKQAPPPRRAAPAQSAPRPRRTTSQTPPAPPPPPTPQPVRAPQPAPAPQPQEAQQAKAPSRRGLGWLVFAAIWVVSAIAGLIGGESDNGIPDISINVPEITIDFGDLTSSTVLGETGFMNIRDVTPGACIEALPLGDIVDDVLVVDCVEEHQYEVFANTTLGDSPDTYPGFQPVVDAAQDACSTYFFDYVGETYASSEWYVDVITPTEAGWNKTDDRVVNCLLYIWDQDTGDAIYVDGSARGSGDAGS